MGRATVLVVLASLVGFPGAPGPALAEQAQNTLTKQEVADGWLLLFDGKTLFGWENHGDGKWKVVDGTLVCEEGAGGWLGTTTEFADCILKCQYRISKTGNSGIFVRAKRDTNRPHIDGYEIQVCDDHPRNPTGSVYGVISTKRPGAKCVTAVEKWQDVEIRVDGNRFRVILNGTKVVDDCDKRPGPGGRPGKFTRGHVGVQYHNPGMKIEYRNIKLKPLGTKPLFNGKDLTGWTPHPGRPGKFTVEPGGVLHAVGGLGSIWAPGEYKDFVLQLDGKTAKEGYQNSGVFFRSIPEQFLQGYEVQIFNKCRNGDRTKPVDWGTGAIYKRQAVRWVYPENGEWFSMTLVAHGKHMATWVNGNQVTDWTDTRRMHANPRRGCRTDAGKIMLQSHDRHSNLSFRNIRLAEYAEVPSK